MKTKQALLILSVVALLGGSYLSAKKKEEYRFRPGKQTEDHQFYYEVYGSIEQFEDGLFSKNGAQWQNLCHADHGIAIRYMGETTTQLPCHEFGGLFSETKQRKWGIADGSGELIIGTFQQIFYRDFVKIMKEDTLRTVNHFGKEGNAINKKMGEAPFVDLTYLGSKKYGGMDWQSLRFFFVKVGNNWYLKGLDIYHWAI